MPSDRALFDPAAYRPPPFHDDEATLHDALAKCFRQKLLSTRFMDLAELLLWRNPAAEPFVEGPVVAADQLTRDQLVLATLFVLDLEVQNGGLSQFLWNRPLWVDHAPMALDAIGCSELAQALRSDIQRVVDICGSVQAYSAAGSLEAYAQQAADIDFSTFEMLYASSDGDRYNKAIDYVRAHLGAFIRGGGVEA